MTIIDSINSRSTRCGWGGVGAGGRAGAILKRWPLKLKTAKSNIDKRMDRRGEKEAIEEGSKTVITRQSAQLATERYQM